MDLADVAQMVGERFFAIKGIEISELGIDVEVQQKRHLSVLGSLPDYDSLLVTLRTCWLCGDGLYGSTCWICNRRWVQRGIRCRYRSICRCRRCDGRVSHQPIRCSSPVKSSLQTVNLFKKCLLLLLHLSQYCAH